MYLVELWSPGGTLKVQCTVRVKGLCPEDGGLPPLIRDAVGFQGTSTARLVTLDRGAGGSGKSGRTDRFYGWT